MRMQKVLQVTVLVLSLFMILAPPTLSPMAVRASPGIIHVPQDYSTIQAAVNAASLGDSILVSSATSPYSGNITIEKSLTLIGESAASTVIDAGGVAPGILVNATSGVSISGFTVRNSASYESEIAIVSSTSVTVSGNIIVSSENPAGNGTFVQNSNGVSLRNNTVTGNIYGIAVQGGFSNTIQSNNVTGNSAADVYLANTTGTQVKNNILRRSQSGLDVWYGSTGNSIARNTVANNTLAGIWMISSFNNQIVNNNVDWNNSTSNSIGVYLQNTSGNEFYYNNIRHNGVQMYGVFGSDLAGNVWNDGGISPRGNFWSNYNGTDNDTDGVGDTNVPWPCPNGGHPCSFNGGPGVDYYPLMNATRPPMLNVTLTPTPINGCSVPVPLQVSFSSTVQGGSPPYQYSWRFGDSGVAGNLTSPIHAYSARGGLFATLTVNDSSLPENSASDTVSITSFTGGLVLHVEDSSKKPMAGVNVTSIAQPPGLGRTYQLTSASGTVSFLCLPPGAYRFQVSDSGYQILVVSVAITNSTLTQTLTLVPLPGQSSFLTSVLLYSGIAVALILILVASVFFRRRGQRRRKLGLSDDTI